VLVEHGDEFPDERSLPAEPRPVAEAPQLPLQFGGGIAEHDIAFPAAEAWLEHSGKGEGGRRRVVVDVRGRRLGDALSSRQGGGRELVVERGQRGGRGEHAGAPVLNPAWLPDAVLATVECPSHVETAEDEIGAARASADPRRLDDVRADGAFPHCADDALVRDRRASRDPHNGRARSAPRAVSVGRASAIV
jgi:hypothetical protein